MLVKKSNNNKKGRKTLRQNQQQQITYRINTQGPSYAPDSIIVDLTYADDQIVRSNAGYKYNYWRIRMNSVYDPDPLVLTGAVSGFTEWANFYRRYLVLSMKVDSTFVNKENFPVGVSAAPSDIDLVALITSPLAAQNMSETPYSIKTKVLSPTGGLDRMSFQKTIDLAKFTGQQGAYDDSLAYSSLVNTNPSTLLFWNFATYSDQNGVNGVFQTTKYTFRVLFTQRQTLLT